MISRKHLLLASLYVASLVVCNIISIKLCNIMGFVISAGILVYPITFLILNVVNEIWGKKNALDLVWAGFIVNLFTFAVFKIGALMPSASFFDNNSFSMVVDGIPRIILACNIAFLVGQCLNVWLFDYVKQKTYTNALWLRNNVSTIAGQIADCMLFYLVAFAPLNLSTSEMSWSQLFSGILISIIFKIIIAICDTPVCYMLVAWAKNSKIAFWFESEREV